MKPILIILSIFILEGCTFFLDYRPKDAFEEDAAFRDYASWEIMLRGCYSSLSNEALYGGFLSMGLGDILTDNVIASPHNNGEYQAIYHWRYHAMDPQITAIWEQAYHTIYLANTIIDQAYPIDDYKKYERRYIQIKAEAKLIRAMVHFDLVRLFSAFPYSSETLGIPYIKQRNHSLYNRETVGSNLSDCLKDINTSIPYLEETTVSSSINKDYAYYLLSMIYNYMGDSDQSLKSLIHINITQEDWLDSKEYKKLWTSYSSNSVIFQLIKTNKDKPNNAWIYYDTRNKRAKWYASSLLVSWYDDADIRKETFFRKSGSKYEIVKYLGQPELDMPNGGSVKILRKAELHFLLWFLQLKNGTDHKIIERDLNRYLTSRGASNYVSAKHKTLKEFIEQEYQKEFVYESKHFFRLKFNQKKINREDNDILMELKSDDYHFNMPIPSVEINANTKMKQNEGYES
ncbi:MAG: RagB/SusD family nutrient uptake outer membrane protein [Prolixibacteraceae bacterium]|jgi:hypothetical protein|nr:RagB/SusD family nutrient uptake outer membrane protein [Prolixibacteraceae bacterium]